MFSRLLTPVERKLVNSFLKQNGAKEDDVRALARRCRKYTPQIEQDLKLIQLFMQTYERTAKKPK